MHIDPDDRTVVYLGPSLALEQARQLIDARFLPPVQLGDIYKLLSTSIDTIIIIDGLFDGSTPVWHREILAAMEAGITVIGATSMGALRAAELHQYGMIGHGTIFEWYRDGHLDGDDEVALMHGVEELGFLKLSEPLVNIRYNLNNAARRGVISQSLCDTLIEESKQQYFGDRQLQALLDSTEHAGCNKSALQNFLRDDYIDLKKQDAISVLTSAQSLREQGGQKAAGWYQRNSRFGTMMHSLELARSAVFKNDGRAINAIDIINTIGSDEEHFEAWQLAAIERYWLLQAVAHAGTIAPANETIMQKWCTERSIDEITVWLSRNGLQRDAWAHRVAEEHAIDALLADITDTNPLLCGTVQHLIDSATETPREWLNGISQGHRAAKIIAIGTWASARGYTPLPEWQENVKTAIPSAAGTPEGTEGAKLIAMYAWFVKDGPDYFGFVFDKLIETYLQVQFSGGVEEMT